MVRLRLAPLTFSLSLSTTRSPPCSTLFPYTTLFRSGRSVHGRHRPCPAAAAGAGRVLPLCRHLSHEPGRPAGTEDRKSTRLNSSHLGISYAVFCLKKKKKHREDAVTPIEEISEYRWQ